MNTRLALVGVVLLALLASCGDGEPTLVPTLEPLKTASPIKLTNEAVLATNAAIESAIIETVTAEAIMRPTWTPEPTKVVVPIWTRKPTQSSKEVAYREAVVNITARGIRALDAFQDLDDALDTPELFFDPVWVARVRKGAQELIGLEAAYQELDPPSNFVRFHQQMLAAHADCAVSGQMVLSLLDALEELDLDTGGAAIRLAIDFLNSCTEKIDIANDLIP